MARSINQIQNIYEFYALGLGEPIAISSHHGIGIGDYGLLNLDEKLKSYLSRWLIWPFDGSTSFVVKLKIYKKELNR